jgi:beta-lactamase class A
VAVLALAAAAALALGAPVTAAAAAVPPDTPAGAQLAWVIDASHRTATPEEVRAHVAPVFLAQVPPEDLAATLAQLGAPSGFALVSVTSLGPTRLRAVVRGVALLRLELAVDASGLIVGLGFVPVPPPAPRSWAALDRRLHAVAPRVSFLAARLNGRACAPVHAVAPDVPRPLGSAFKLYVLGALAHAVAQGRVHWDDRLAIRARWKSLPSGVLQNLAAGTRVPLRRYANLMISISDNTAADHLIRRLGRRAVEAQMTRFGMARPVLDTPFLTTRELFVLKGSADRSLAPRYRALAPEARGRFLTRRVDRVPLSSVRGWTRPRATGSLEWFASAADLCRAYAGLSRQARSQPPVARALSISDGGLALSPSSWPSVWFKGGSEPGVLTLAYRLRARDGRTYVVAALANDRRRPFGELAAGAKLVSLVRGAAALLRP